MNIRNTNNRARPGHTLRAIPRENRPFLRAPRLPRALIAAVLLSVLTLTALTLTAGALEARVTSLQGKVEYRQGSGTWRAAEVGMALPLGATISTGFNSSADLEIGPATLQVRALSRMRLDELVEQEGLVQSELHLQVGRVRADVRSAPGVQSEFRLSSPVATAAVRGTSFEFDGVNLQVETGTVQLANQYNEAVSVGGGESSNAASDEPPPPPADTREAATTVQVFTTGGDETTPRTEGTSSGTTATTGSVRLDWRIVGWDEN